jgi:membrane protein required for beta-lactamase induction
MMFFDNLQWVRGWSFLDAGAHIAYRKVIGAYKKEPLISFRILGFLISIGEKEVRQDSDAFIPAWSQKSAGALRQLKVDQVNHGLMANHPEMTRRFNEIMSDRTLPPFLLK